MAKHVLIFAANYLPNVAGAEVAVKELTDRLGRDGFTFSMIVPKFTREVAPFEAIGPVGVHRVGFGVSFDKFLLPFLGVLKARSLEKEKPADIAWGIMASYGGIAGAFFKKLYPKKKYVLTLQEGDEEEHLKRYAFGVDFVYKLLIRPWYLLPFRVADRITAISEYLKERALASGASVPIDIVPNGVNIALFSRTVPEEKKQAIRTKLGKKEGDVFLVTTSRLVKKNAVGDVIQSLVYLPQYVRFIVIGTGEEQADLRSLAEVYGVAHRVRFLGFIPNGDLPDYLAVSDIFVRPSLSEGFGVSFVEAMAAGVPVIATPVGGIVDFLRDGETGLLCAPKNPRDIAKKVQLLHENAALRTSIVHQAKNMVLERYDWGVIASKMKASLLRA